MRPVEIKDIISGVLTIILLSLALGQYGKLEKFARIEAAKALRPKPVPTFFPNGFGGR